MSAIPADMPLSTQDGLPKSIRLRAMTAVAMAVLLSVLDYTVVNIAMPDIARDVHVTASAAIWVVNAYQLASLIALLPVASLGEKFGHARMCRIGLVTFVGASLLCAASQTLPELAAARAIQGLGGACILGVNAALIRYIYPAKILGRGIALNGLVIALGVALGPSVAAAVLSFASWKWLFLINLPLGAVAMYFAVSALPKTPRTPVKFDALSAVLLALGLGGIVTGGDNFAQGGSAGVGIALLAIGLICMAVLVRLQLSQPHPLLPVDLLARAGFSIAFTTGFLAFVASNFFIISMPFNLTNVLHRGPVETGLVITAWPVAIVVTAPFVGRLADRYPAAFLTSIGMLITGIGFLLLRLLPAHPTDIDIAWRIAVAGCGFSMIQPPNNKAMLTTAPKHRLAGASGMISVSRLLGQTIGGMLVALTLGFAQPAPTKTCLTFAFLAAILGAMLSFSRVLAKKSD
ncbi:MFS transporter [Acidisoma cellulosilyticum]|uniref:MFS transporter n=1 Tax=Acidisoma cellulosilyticum TaxID=2802395 RepID=UPI001D0A5A01|nr:MFS transporter [Acidisoma cellulosilyticum]